MKIDILTLFPEMFEPLKQSILGRAIENNLIEINLINIRDFSKDKHKKVDDTPYGGGAGMVLMCDPIVRAIEDLKGNDSLVILLCPQGKMFNQSKVKELSEYRHLIIICGHYEGFDERIREFVDLELSIGDYILTGGELPAMIITDAVTRLLPGVINEESFINDSFNDNLLDYPTYTRPEVYRGLKVPDVLLSGNHAKIKEFREAQRYKRTKERRPDLLEDSNE